MRVYNIDREAKTNFVKNLGYKYQLIFRLGCATGLRISDIVKLEKSILAKKEPTIREQKTKKSKRFYIPKKLRQELETYSKNNQVYIFESTSKTGHITRQAVWKHFKLIAKKTGIKINVGTHTMRKNHAKELQLSGKGYNYIKNKLNHDNLADTLLYLIEE
jgi:integrase